MMMEVRCCCQPRKLLGWLPVPEDASVARFVIPPRVRFACRVLVDGEPVAADSPRTIALPIATISLPGGISHSALKSEETPIETLRQIPGFVENTEVVP